MDKDFYYCVKNKDVFEFYKCTNSVCGHEIKVEETSCHKLSKELAEKFNCILPK